MSETKEIVEKPPALIPETLDEEKLTDVSIDISKKDSDISMLEDEEMPTYSSISSSTKPNNSVSTYDQKINDAPMERNRTPSPEPSEDQDNDDNESIYVVSSTADTDRNLDDVDDEVEEDYDSEEMNEDEEDEDDDEEDEEEDDDGRDEYDEERFERESDDFDQDRFERASDDFVLRHNNSLKQYFKERSLSLQDLATMEARYNRRRNLSRFQYYPDVPVFKPNVYSPYALNSKPYQGVGRYEHIESKVKRYIQNIKDHEKPSKIQNSAKIKDYKENKTKPIVGGKQIKEYAEKVIKKLEQDELCEDQLSTYATLERVENGEEDESLKLPPEKFSTHTNVPMEVDHSPRSQQINDNKYEKVNGIVEFDVESEVTFTPILKEESLHRTNEQINGSDPSKNCINVRTLSYEEYMRGVPQEETEVEVESTEVCVISPEKMSCDTLNAKQNNINDTDSIKITNVRSNCHDSKDDEIYQHKDRNVIKMINQATETIKVETPELKKLQALLTERNSQFESIKIAYQKTLAENLAMKQEIASLKKTLKKHEEYQSRETKSTSVQTEILENEDSQRVNVTEGKNNKISASSITSAVSSAHQWSESGFSPTISIASPDVKKTLNSDDSSVFEKTTKHPPRTLSRAFITSSRILQTLSNITQKKWNVSSPFTQDQKNQERLDQLKSSEDPSSSGTPLNSKKRKATEMLGVPGFEQPFKIPHTSGSGRKKINQDFNNDTSQMNGLPPQNEHFLEDGKNGEEEENEEDNVKKDLGDNLKYYIYQDEENSNERNFLIQAEETGKIPSKGVVRECGPYLLGNLQVRMTEVNGTINIWGKEINVDSTEEEFDLSGKSAELKSSLSWQKTPQRNSLNNSYMASSTEKKSKPQSRFNESNISKFSHFSDSNIPKSSPLETSNQSCHRRSSLTSDDNCTSRTHRLSWSGCKHLMEEQRHAFHSRHSGMDCERCSCIHNVKRCECHPCNRVQECTENYRRHSFSGGSNKTSMDSQCLNHSSHCLQFGNEGHFRHKIGHCQSSYGEGENCQQFSKQCHLSKELTHSYNPKNITINSECRGSGSSSCCHSRNFSNQEDDPLIPTQQSLEPTEVQKKRLSGKKVRTLLMDLLKGCGDCRNPNPANISKSTITSRDCQPEIVVTPCSPRASYSSPSQLMEKNRCCDTCSRRIEMSAEIEAQLEVFRIEMERLRSRSDALLDKLNMLKSTDIN